MSVTSLRLLWRLLNAEKESGCFEAEFADEETMRLWQGNEVRMELPVTRPSCLECVEKHLGAAWVLLAEYRDGYPHRLRAIGHLHEAEDESQD